MAFTDPTGYASKALQYIGAIIAIVAAVITQQYWALGKIGAAFAAAGAGGFLSGFVASGGNFKQGLIGAFTSMATVGIGVANLGEIAQFVANGAVQGVAEVLQGGKFGHGFASAAVFALASPITNNVRNPVGKVVAGAIVGGTASKVTGGKFANGAAMGAFRTAAGEIARRGMYSSGAQGRERTVITKEAQLEFKKLGESVSTNIHKSAEAAATAFADTFLPFTEKYGLEVGANIVLVSGGFALEDTTLGGRTGVGIPFNDYAQAVVHTHPGGVDDGFSGSLRFVGGRMKVSAGGDYATMWSDRKSGYVFRAGDGAGWHFDFGAFDAAVNNARAAGVDTYAEWYTRRVR